MIIDCAQCIARPAACGDCVVTVVLGSGDGHLAFDAEEQTAVAVLAGSGLVPPLRMVPVRDGEEGAAESAAPEVRPGAPRVGTSTRWSRRSRAG